MFAKQNMLFVKNTGIKKFLLISLFFSPAHALWQALVMLLLQLKIFPV